MYQFLSLLVLANAYWSHWEAMALSPAGCEEGSEFLRELGHRLCRARADAGHEGADMRAGAFTMSAAGRALPRRP